MTGRWWNLINLRMQDWLHVVKLFALELSARVWGLARIFILYSRDLFLRDSKAVDKSLQMYYDNIDLSIKGGVCNVKNDSSSGG